MTGIWNIGNLADGVTVTLSIAATVDTGTNGSMITNMAGVTTLDQVDNNSVNDSASVDIIVNFPDLTLTKTVNDATPSEGQTITYSIKVTNNGDGSGTGIEILDLLPAGVTYAGTTTIDQGSYDSVTGVWDIGTLASGVNVDLVLEATVDGNGATSGSTITNTASVNALDQTDPNTGDNSASVDIVVNTPDILVTKSVDDDTPDEGQLIIYTIDAENIGLADAYASGLTITDLLPSGLIYDSSSTVIPSGTTYDPMTGIWNIGNLADGVTVTLSIAATVDTGTNGSMITNMAGVTTLDQVDNNSANDSASVNIIVNSPDIAITKTVSIGPYNENENFTYTINVENLGNAPATGLSVRDLLPAILTFVSAVPDQGTYNEVTGIWDIGTLAVGVDIDLVLTVYAITGTSGTEVNNIVKLYTLDQNDPNTSNNISNVEIEISTADLLIVKSVNDATPSEGQLVTFTILLENNGPGNASTIVVEDILPDGLIFTAFTQVPTGTATNYDSLSRTIIWTTPTLTPGNISLKFTGTIETGYGAQTITNIAKIDDFDQVDPDHSDNMSSVDLLVDGLILKCPKPWII